VLIIARPCQRELDDLPEEVRGDLADAIARLERGLMLSMSLSRPMPSIGRGVHELRLTHRSGTYRVFYALRRGAIYILGAFKKKGQKTPQRVMEVIRERVSKEVRS